jgi:hypothetical protein
MRVLLFLLFVAVDYYAVFVYFRKKNRRTTFVSLAWLTGAVLLGKISSFLLGSSRPYPENIRTSALFSLLLILFTAFFIQLVARFANQAPGWQREQPKVILRNQPLNLLFTEALPMAFFFVGSLIILWGVWLGPIGHTL